jgi:glucokinase
MALLGIDIGGTNLRVGRVVGQSIEKVLSERIEDKQSQDAVLQQLFSLVRKMMTPDITGIGVGVPSSVDPISGVVYNVNNIPSWKEVHLKELLYNQFNVPVFVNNDANCFILGEKYYGKAQHASSAVGLIVGTGLGSGLVFNNKLYNGLNCGAGEIGLIPFRESILEHYCCGQFFERNYGISASEAATLALAGDEKALKMFDEFGANLGQAINIVLAVYAPEIIVLGGSVPKAFSLFEPAMRKVMSTFLFAKTVHDVRIEVSEIENVAIYGAASLVHDAME